MASSMTDQSSDEAPKLLPGRTAWDWNIRTLSAFGYVLFSTVLMMIGSFQDAPARFVLVAFGFVGLLGGGIVAWDMNIKRADTVYRELDAGYTTLFGRSYRDYWQLDHRTGVVIRRPGETRPRGP